MHFMRFLSVVMMLFVASSCHAVIVSLDLYRTIIAGKAYYILLAGDAHIGDEDLTLIKQEQRDFIELGKQLRADNVLFVLEDFTHYPGTNVWIQAYAKIPETFENEKKLLTEAEQAITKLNHMMHTTTQKLLTVNASLASLSTLLSAYIGTPGLTVPIIMPGQARYEGSNPALVNLVMQFNTTQTKLLELSTNLQNYIIMHTDLAFRYAELKGKLLSNISCLKGLTSILHSNSIKAVNADIRTTFMLSLSPKFKDKITHAEVIKDLNENLADIRKRINEAHLNTGPIGEYFEKKLIVAQKGITEAELTGNLTEPIIVSLFETNVLTYAFSAVAQGTQYVIIITGKIHNERYKHALTTAGYIQIGQTLEQTTEQGQSLALTFVAIHHPTRLHFCQNVLTCALGVKNAVNQLFAEAKKTEAKAIAAASSPALSSSSSASVAVGVQPEVQPPASGGEAELKTRKRKPTSQKVEEGEGESGEQVQQKPVKKARKK